ncbi:long-chain-acyl-CoA synthetase [Litoribrevibacter albus]|uniref:Long-chain-acyl-CoA synthetase n=1 Tax=Litoribrevibacter albus TaxID=1473156 RepID=A0AA37SEI1_9GAMM|nr:long-chain-acyl-CoA synthetase [Litoribrevibacter albus]GLQ33638.1 long-chain-acyl-CoA synthetase [Litoribrevibacter albus]
MSEVQQTIQFKQILPRVPTLLANLHNVVKGLVLANNTNPEKNHGLAWCIERAVKRNPDGIAIKSDQGNITYREFNQRANQIAHFLEAQGYQIGDTIAVMMDNRAELLITIAALAKIGVAAAMVNTAQTHKVLTHSISIVNPKGVIVGSELHQSIDDIKAELPLSEDQFFFVPDGDTVSEIPGYRHLPQEASNSPKHNPDTSKRVKRDDPLFYIYTSGTTGLPKAAIFKNGRWMKAFGTFGFIIARLNKDDTLYSTLPLYHATGLVILWGSALAGSSAFAIRRKFSASQFWSDCRKYDATAIGYVGELCRYLINAPASAEDRNHSVTKMIGNGLRPGIWKDFKQRFNIQNVFELYASSEGNVGFSNIFNFDCTVGFSPVPYAIVKYDKEADQPIRDSKGFLQPVKKGEVGLLIGEICPKAPFDGYNDPEKTKSCILENVFKQGDRYFNTGDLMRHMGYRHAQFVDRVGDTFRWKGENVSTTEVEHILNEHPDVSESVCYGVEIQDTNGRAGMVAVTPHENIAFDPNKLMSHLNSELPSYAVPVFIREQQQLQTTGTFKYQKHTLKDEAFNPEKVSDKLWVLLPGEQAYTEVDPTLYSKIQAGEFRF